MFGMKKSFDTHLRDKLAIIASEIKPNSFNKEKLLEIQHKYKVFPLFVQIIKTDHINIKPGFSTNVVNTPLQREKVLTYTIIKKPYIIKISTLYSTNDDKIEIIKIISLIASFIIYLISLFIGWKFIETISKEIELNIKRLKNFNSNVSHELKTPLAIIKSKIDVALMNKEKECDKLLYEILEEIEYINDITEKLLFLTKNYNTKKFEKIDLEELVFELYEKYENKIEFELHIGEDDYIILGDKTLLKIALGNIIENSIKYGASKIIITLQKIKNKIILSIKDNGIGIPKEKLPFIFDEFYRVDESHCKNVKGFGLGLSIVKNILNLHKAKVEVKSQGGVEFIIEFKAHQE
ncbi:sensor histidine kinase [Caminibacter sp.]